MSHVTYHMSHVTCPISLVTCDISNVTCHMSLVTSYMQYACMWVSHVHAHGHLMGGSPQICTMGHLSILNLKKRIRVQILAVGQQFVITNGEETIGSPNFW